MLIPRDLPPAVRRPPFPFPLSTSPWEKVARSPWLSPRRSNSFRPLSQRLSKSNFMRGRPCLSANRSRPPSNGSRLHDQGDQESAGALYHGRGHLRQGVRGQHRGQLAQCARCQAHVPQQREPPRRNPNPKRREREKRRETRDERREMAEKRQETRDKGEKRRETRDKRKKAREKGRERRGGSRRALVLLLTPILHPPLLSPSSSPSSSLAARPIGRGNSYEVE